MKKLLLVLVLAALLVVPVSGCQSEDARILIPVTDSPPPLSEEEAPDDVIPTPGGYAYRANVHEQGKENPWPPIDTAVVQLGSGSNKVDVRYRNHIVTEAGKTRNNILQVFRQDGFFRESGLGSIRLYALETPSGLELYHQGGGGLPGALVAILTIEIPPDTEPGIYELEIGLEIQGKDYGTVPCTVEVVKSIIEKSMVKVFEAGESESPVAFGVVVGDGNQVLTVLNYEEYTPEPGSLEIVTATEKRFSASIEAIDPRTSVTLLRVEGADLPPARIGNSAKIYSGQEVFVQGWHAGITFKKASAKLTHPTDWPPKFDVWLTTEAMERGDAVTGKGAAITDRDGNVIGLTGTLYNRLVIVLGGPGLISNCVPINSALELLAPDATSRAWADGPAVTTILAESGATSALGNILPSVSAYDEMTEAVQELFETLGEPLDDDDDELARGYRHYILSAASSPDWYDGDLLTLCYPGLQELRNTDGKLIARAKWVGLQWDRSEGKPDHLFYGTEPYELEGIFELTGTMHYLEEALK